MGGSPDYLHFEILREENPEEKSERVVEPRGGERKE